MGISHAHAVDLVYFDFGGGHRSAMVALKQQLAENYPDWKIEPVNLFDDVFRKKALWEKSKKKRIEDLYGIMLQHELTYGWGPTLRVTQQLIRLANRPIQYLVHEFWAERKTDLVVSLIPNFNISLYQGLAQVHPETPFVILMTDLFDCPSHFWQEEKLAQRPNSFIICGTRRSACQARTIGYSPDRVFETSGMILKAPFYSKPLGDDEDCRAARQKLGLDADKTTAMIMFGGQGSHAAKTIVRMFNASSVDVQCIVMCGSHKKLFDDLQNVPFCHPVAFTSDEVPYYMWLAGGPSGGRGGFLVGKPGPGTISEGIKMKLPLILKSNSATMPQELGNALWVEENGLGVVVRKSKQVVKAAELLLANQGAMLKKVRANMNGADNRALYEIPDILGDIINMNSSTLGPSSYLDPLRRAVV